MYCRMCGNKLGDADRYCQLCGAPTGYKEPSDISEEKPEREEVVFNPPYENRSRFTEEHSVPAEGDLSEKEKVEDFKGSISENEMEAAQPKLGEASFSEPVKDNEFTWNVYEFPTARKKTEDIEFNWSMDELSQPPQNEAEASDLEENLFQEISNDDLSSKKDHNIDRFFTFSRKNEEFQELLDKEYDKLKKRSGPYRDISGVKEVKSEPGIDIECTGEGAEIRQRAGESPAEAVHINPGVQAEQEQREEALPEQEQREENPIETEIVPLESDVPEKAEHITEMAHARAQFFGEELVRDNESIKKRLNNAAQAETDSEQAETVNSEQAETADTQAETGGAEEAEQTAEQSFGPQKSMEDYIREEKEAEDYTEISSDSGEVDHRAESVAAAYIAAASEKSDEKENTEAPPAPAAGSEDDKEEKPRKSAGQIILVIIAIILAAEIAILGIRYFAPDSAAARTIGDVHEGIFNTVAGWADGIGDVFSGKDFDEGTTIPEDSQKDADDATSKDGEPDQQPTDVETSAPAPDSNPIADKDALVASQLGNNKNIQKVEANTALTYKAGKNYGLSDINNSQPITNNIWQVPESGDPVYYDKSVVGTIIAFDSQWIDYVNGSSKSVLDLTKKDSKAYQNTIAYSKVGKIKETFKLLEIGEIRQGAKGFYVWVHEEIQITENGTVTDKKYNWIYYLEPTDGKMQIVNYFKLL